MAEPGYTEDFCIKEEDLFSMKDDVENLTDMYPSSTACMPIPTRRTIDLSQIRDCGLDYGSSPVLVQDHDKYTNINSNVLWSSKVSGNDVELTKMEEDDIFQVDKSDLIQDTTLTTELNTNQEIIDDLNFDDLMLPGEFSYVINVPNVGRRSPGPHPLTNTPISSFGSSYTSSFLAENASFCKDSVDSSSVTSSPLNIITSNAKTYLSLESPQSPLILSPTSVQKHNISLHELLVKKESPLMSPTSSKMFGQSVPGPGMMQQGRNILRNSSSSRLSSSAPTHLGLDQIWQRREPRPHLLSTGSLIEGGSTSSLSTDILSPDAYDFSLDEACDSEFDSDQDDDFSSDAAIDTLKS